MANQSDKYLRAGAPIIDPEERLRVAMARQ
jgi:hypothetical protein